MATESVREHIRHALAAAIESERERLRVEEERRADAQQREDANEARRIQMLAPLVEIFQELAAEIADLNRVSIDISRQRDMVTVKVGMDASERSGKFYQVFVHCHKELFAESEVFTFHVDENHGNVLTGWSHYRRHIFETGEEAMQLILQKVAEEAVRQGMSS